MTGEVLELLPNFEPVLTYFTDQIIVFGQNPIIAFFIAGLVGAILAVLPEKLRKYGMVVSIAISIGLVSLVAQAGRMELVDTWNIVLIGLILGVVTSKGYDFFKSQMKE